MTPQKQRALEALMTQTSKAAAAEAAGIGERTLRNYLHDEEFVEQYRQAVCEMLGDIATEGRLLMSPALETLGEIAGDEEAPKMARITAARAVLDYALKLTHEFHVMQRVELAESILKKLEEEGGR